VGVRERREGLHEDPIRLARDLADRTDPADPVGSLDQLEVDRSSSMYVHARAQPRSPGKASKEGVSAGGPAPGSAAVPGGLWSLASPWSVGGP